MTVETSQRVLAERRGIRHRKANHCLNALTEQGLAKLSYFANARHRLHYAYPLTPAGIAGEAALTKRLLQRLMADYESLRAEIAALKAEYPPTHIAQ